MVLEEGLEEAFALEELSDLVEETFEVGPWASLSSVQMIGVPSAVMGTSFSAACRVVSAPRGTRSVRGCMRVWLSIVISGVSRPWV